MSTALQQMARSTRVQESYARIRVPFKIAPSPSSKEASAGWPAGWLVSGMPAMRLGHENASETRTLKTKVREIYAFSSRKSYPKRGCLFGFGKNPKMILSQNCNDFDTKTYRFEHISGPSYRGKHAGWPVDWLVGWLAGWPGHQKGVKNAYP